MQNESIPLGKALFSRLFFTNLDEAEHSGVQNCC